MLATLLALMLLNSHLQDPLSMDEESRAQRRDEDKSREVLKGLEAISVVVNDLPPTVERAGLTKRQLHTEAELRLRRAGIRVIRMEEDLALRRSAVLVVTAGVQEAEEGRYIYHIELLVLQPAALVRDPAINTLATTWASPAWMGLVSRTELNVVRERVGDLADQFSNAFLAVNPPQRNAEEP